MARVTDCWPVSRMGMAILRLMDAPDGKQLETGVTGMAGSRGNHATSERDGDASVSTWLADSGQSPELRAAAPAARREVALPDGRGKPPLYGVNVQMGEQGMSVQARPSVALALIRAFADAMEAETSEP